MGYSDIKQLDGKLFRMTAHPEAGCCATAMFMGYSCCSPLVMQQKQVDEKTVAGTNVTMCWGLLPFSPIPCCLCCGVGPCKAEFTFKQDDEDATKWVGFGSVLTSGCCSVLTDHKGDVFHFNENHNGSVDQPMEMIAGKNNINPPCLWGVKVGLFREVGDRKGRPPAATRTGAPDVEAIAR